MIAEVQSLTRELLAIPDDFLVGIVPGSDTGAVEMAIWNFINGDRMISTLAWEAFGEEWATDIAGLIGEQSLIRHSSPYGSVPDLSAVDWSTDIVFAWNGTTSGVKIPIDDLRRHVPEQRDNIIISDLTSAAFAMPIDWSIVDVGTLSWQKALGGEAAHGMLFLSPRAVKRLEESPPSRPLPKIMRLLDENKRLNRSLFEGNVINTISMLCLEDFRQALLWAKAIGPEGLFARCDANVAAVAEAVARYPWLTFLAKDERLRSPCGCCLKIDDMSSDEIKQMVNILGAEDVAYDIAAYRSAPRGIRIWCGCTVEASDIRALVPWLGWAHDIVKNPQTPAGVDGVGRGAASQREAIGGAPSAASLAVAECALAHSLSMIRQLGIADRAAREGLWIKAKLAGGTVRDRRIGIVGFGSVGAAVADRFRAFGGRVIVFDGYISAMQRARRAGFELAEDLDDLFTKATLVSLHVPLTDATRHMVDERRIALMPAGSYIVNVACGGLVDERALLNGLNTGQIAGAASDVFEIEPFAWQDDTVRELLRHPNFQSTPHIGADPADAQKTAASETPEQTIQRLPGSTP